MWAKFWWLVLAHGHTPSRGSRRCKFDGGEKVEQSSNIEGQSTEYGKPWVLVESCVVVPPPFIAFIPSKA
jgi:hypothetical protein